jgi:hypothetical protein
VRKEKIRELLASTIVTKLDCELLINGKGPFKGALSPTGVVHGHVFLATHYEDKIVPAGVSTTFSKNEVENFTVSTNEIRFNIDGGLAGELAITLRLQ